MMHIFNRKHIAYIYKITLPILALMALLVLVTLGADYFCPDKQPTAIFILNALIWLVFTVDFIVRTHLSDDGSHFITSHLAEFIAIIPVTPMLLLADALIDIDMMDFARSMLEAVFVIKFFAFLIRAFTTQRRLIRTNPLHYAAGITMTALVIAAVLFSIFEGKSYGDGIWWAFVTASTTGFGDIVPVTQGGRIVGIFLMVVGVSCISMLTGAIAIRLMYANDRLPQKESVIIKNTIIELTHFSELSSEEVEYICTTLKRMKDGQRQHTPETKRPHKDTYSSNSFIKWIMQTFISNPNDDLLIEEKLDEVIKIAEGKTVSKNKK